MAKTTGQALAGLGRVRYSRVASVVGGAAVALGLLEVAVRTLSSREPIPLPHIMADAFDAPVVTRRQIDEGVATSHFSVTGARMTGNAPMDSGATAVILGDSYVVAREVSDEKTMGAELERIARAHGVPLDVRQYGWIAASPARYLLAAPQVLARWHPQRVIIPMADNDLDFNAAVMAWPGLRVSRSGDLHIVGPHGDPAYEPPPRSELWVLVRHRWSLLRARAPSWARLPVIRGRVVASAIVESGEFSTRPDSSELSQLPGAVVRALANAYGPGLVLLYLPEVGVTGGDSASSIEPLFLAACRVNHVTCQSTREIMLDARQHGVIARGSATTTLGDGHLNAGGHKLVAMAMWKLLRLNQATTATAKDRTGSGR